MKKNFNRDRFFGNIYALIKQQRMKVGEIERLADVSTGYLARLARDKEGSVPSVEFVANIAEALGVTVDFLLYGNLGTLTPNERYLITVFEQLISDTQKGLIIWQCEKGYIFRGLDEYGEVGRFTHPLYSETITTTENFLEEPSELAYYSYESGFAGEHPVNVCGDCFHVELPLADATCYLMNAKPVNFDDNQNGFELYLINKDEILPLACTWEVADEIRHKIETLYSTVAEAASHIKLDDKAKGILDRYLESGRPFQNNSDDDGFVNIPDDSSEDGWM